MLSDLGPVIQSQTWDECRDRLIGSLPQILIVDADPWDENRDWLARVASLQSIEHQLVIIMLSPNRDAENAIAAIGHGCYDYLVKPLNLPHLRRVINEAIRIVRQSPVIPRTPLDSDSGDHIQSERPVSIRPRLIGHSQAMLRVYKQIGQAAPSDVEVLVTGESGTGKELVCRALHDNSPRREQPFIAINCAAIPDTLLESELFGHERGAFTGADRKRIGKFEQAAGGTILLDEIGDMSPSLQAKMLRLVQDRTFYRVGGNELLHADVRIMAATHQPLEQHIADGTFRADLFFRLRVVHIDLKPLRQREADIIHLAHHFAAMFNRELKRNITAFHPETNKILLKHTWPGNVRELQNVVKQAMVVSQGSTLLPEFLPQLVSLGFTTTDQTATPVAATQRTRTSFQSTAQFALHDSVPETRDDPDLTQIARRILDANDHNAYKTAKSSLDRALIAEALRTHYGNISAAARHLGITRLTLRRKINEFDDSAQHHNIPAEPE